MAAPQMETGRRIAAIRRFNRFYTRQIGVLNEGLLRSSFSLTEARVLYELAQGERVTASELSRELGLDPGYLSRLVRGFEKRRLLRRLPLETDGRQFLLSLTPAGREVFAGLNERSDEEIRGMLSRLPEAGQDRAVEAMETIEAVLGVDGGGRAASYVLRPHRPGDMGWVVHRHGVLYAREYGWDERFEALVAGIVKSFVERYDPARERCWIAECNGVPAGSVFVVRKSETTAQLRMLLVEPWARGMGIGRRLVEECVRFSRQAGYRKMMLWTNDVLVSARRIYEAAGFRLKKEERHHSFGHDLVGQFWEMKL